MSLPVAIVKKFPPITKQRKQARLGYIFPAAFERQFYENRLAA